MAVRREKIVLELDDQATPGLLRAAAAAQLAHDRISGMGGSSRSTSRETDRLASSSRSASRETDRLGRSAQDMERNARRAERGSSALVDSIVALGPALVPISAVAVPALAGLTAQMGVAAAAGGTLLLAFQGVGDALKAVTKFRADPSAANFDAMQEALSTLPVQAQQFVATLDSMRPVLRQLRNDSAGVFPGMTQGLDDLLGRLPQVRAFLQTVAGATGNLFAESGEALAGEKFDDFFDYLNATAAPTLSGFGHSVGNLAQTFANLMVATAPLQSDFTNWLEGATRSLANWSAGLDGTEGLEGFIDYVRDAGPEVGDALASISGALISVVQAAGPLGGPTLKGLTALADLVDRIASSPLGTPLIAMASGLALVNRALSVSALAQDSLVADILRGRSRGGGSSGPDSEELGGVFGSLGQRIGRARTSIRSLGPDLRSMSREYERGGRTMSLFRSGLSNTSDAAQRTRSTLVGAGRAAGTVGALTLATSGLGDQLGLTNTASLALAGTMAGPVGAGVGAAVGAFLDLRAAGEETADTIEQMNRAAKGADLNELAASIKKSQAQVNRAKNPQGLDQFKVFGRQAGSLLQGNNPFNDQAETDRAKKSYNELRATYLQFADAVGTPLPGNASRAQIMTFAEQAQPQLAKLGLSLDDLAKAGKSGGRSGVADIAARLATLSTQSQVVPAQMSAIDTAVANMNTGLLTASQSAQQFSTALADALNPKVGLDAARDQLAATMRSLSDLKGFAGVARSRQTPEAEANRALVRSAVSDTQALLKAQADAGRGSDVLGATLQRSRRQIIDQGIAAGISRKEMRTYVDSLGLTPRLVQTVVKANTEAAQAKVRAFLNTLSLTPKDKKTLMTLAASGATGQLRAYINRLKLTPAQKKTLFQALTSAASGNISALQRQIDALHGKEVRVAVNTINTTVNRAINEVIGGSGSARGNLFETTDVRTYARGGSSDDRANAHQPKVYAPSPVYRIFAEPETMGEAYIPLAPDGRRPRAKAITEQVAARFGGTIAWNALGSITPGKDESDYNLSVLQQQQEINEIKGELSATRIVGQRKVKQGRRTVLVGGRRVPALQGLARQIKQAELRSALLNLQEIKAQYAYDIAAPERQVEIDAEKNRAQASRDAAKALTASTGDLSGDSGIFARGASAGGALSSINRQIADVSTYGQIVSQLRAAGASPGLLAQVVSKGESGDLRSAIRMGRALLAQPDAIKGLNASLAELNRVSTSVATYTNSAAFQSGQGALAGPAVGQPISVVVKIDPNADPNTQSREIARNVAFQVTDALSGVTG